MGKTMLIIYREWKKQEILADTSIRCLKYPTSRNNVVGPTALDL